MCPVILDLGIAQGPRAAATDGKRRGTFRYVAPEQLAAGVATPRADLYAIGVMLYEALTGEAYRSEPDRGPHPPRRRDRSPLQVARRRHRSTCPIRVRDVDQPPPFEACGGAAGVRARRPRRARPRGRGRRLAARRSVRRSGRRAGRLRSPRRGRRRPSTSGARSGRGGRDSWRRWRAIARGRGRGRGVGGGRRPAPGPESRPGRRSSAAPAPPMPTSRGRSRTSGSTWTGAASCSPTTSSALPPAVRAALDAGRRPRARDPHLGRAARRRGGARRRSRPTRCVGSSPAAIACTTSPRTRRSSSGAGPAGGRVGSSRSSTPGAAPAWAGGTAVATTSAASTSTSCSAACGPSRPARPRPPPGPRHRRAASASVRDRARGAPRLRAAPGRRPRDPAGRDRDARPPSSRRSGLVDRTPGGVWDVLSLPGDATRAPRRPRAPTCTRASPGPCRWATSGGLMHTVAAGRHEEVPAESIAAARALFREGDAEGARTAIAEGLGALALHPDPEVTSRLLRAPGADRPADGHEARPRRGPPPPRLPPARRRRWTASSAWRGPSSTRWTASRPGRWRSCPSIEE